MVCPSLVDLCILKTAELLKKHYWSVGDTDYFEDENNQFCAFPPSINEKLLSVVIELSPSGLLNVKDVFPVLTSGRLTAFKLFDMLLTIENFVDILMTLSLHGAQLNTLILCKVFTSDDYGRYATKVSSMKSTAIEYLIAMSPNLEHIEIDIPFKLKELQKLKSLKHLELKFQPQDKLFDLLPRIDEYAFVPNDSIKYISIFEHFSKAIPVEEIAFLLQYFIELTCLENNISEALSILHYHELYVGTLSHKYKLQKAILGTILLTAPRGVASVSTIHIASITCPYLKELDVLVDDHQAIAVLRDFLNLESLLLQWETVEPGDFRLGVQLVLESIGSQLKTLFILNFRNIDFGVIGQYCPNLKLLSVEYDGEVQSAYKPPSCFQHLESLKLDNLTQSRALSQSDTLVFVLSNSVNLTSLYLDTVPCLTDDVISSALQKNSFSNLKEVTLRACAFTETGFRMFVEKCKSLEFFHFSSTNLLFEDAIAIVHDVNPLIILGPMEQ